MEYGELLSRTYTLPQRGVEAQKGGVRAPKQPASPDEGDFEKSLPDFLKKPPEGLQFTTQRQADKSRELYQAWAGMRQYARDMWVNNRINVLEPDPSNPDSVIANQAMSMRLGMLLADIEESKAGQKLYHEVIAPRILEGKATPTAGFATQGAFSASAPLTQQATPVVELPATTAFKTEMLGVQDTSPASIADMNNRKQLLINDFENKKALDPTNAGVYEQQIEILKNLGAYKQSETGIAFGGSGQFAGIAQITDTLAKLSLGDPTMYVQPTTPRYSPNGNPLLVASESPLNGQNYGVSTKDNTKPFRVAGTFYDPVTKEMWVVDETQNEWKKVSTNGNNIYDVLSKFSKSNSTLYPMNNINKYLSDVGLTNLTFSSASLLGRTQGQNYLTGLQQSLTAQEPQVIKAAETAQIGQQELNKLLSGLWTKDKLNITAGWPEILGLTIPPILMDQYRRGELSIPTMSGFDIPIKRGKVSGTFKLGGDNPADVFSLDPTKKFYIIAGQGGREKKIEVGRIDKLSGEEVSTILKDVLGVDLSSPLFQPTTPPATPSTTSGGSKKAVPGFSVPKN